jgi:hypothetical protein
MGDSRTKPTGETGYIRVSRARETPEFVTVPFPKTKEDVERYVAGPFVQAAAHHAFFPFKVLGSPEQNDTDDFDFRLETSSGPKYLELMEVHLRDIVDAGDPSGPASYEMDRAANHILGGIQTKSLKYQGATSRGIILLTYVTHWQFTLADPVFPLLMHSMLQEPPIFEQVYHMSFLGPAEVSVSLLYPIPGEVLKGFDPVQYRGVRYIRLNPHNYFQINESLKVFHTVCVTV